MDGHSIGLEGVIHFGALVSNSIVDIFEGLDKKLIEIVFVLIQPNNGIAELTK
jgi:hypothetical protein